jgi:hypothetical protein
MAKRKIAVFYAWQSDRDESGNRNFICIALDEAAKSINEEGKLAVEVKIDADTEGVVGTPPVTETILKKFRSRHRRSRSHFRCGDRRREARSRSECHG